MRVVTVVGVVGALVLVVLGPVAHLAVPWTSGNGQTGAQYSIIARNFLRFGVGDPLLAQRTQTGEVPGASGGRYANHPPLVPLAVAASFGLTGSDEPWAARLAIVPAALGALALLAWLVMRAGDRGLAGWTILVALASVAFLRYGAFVDPVGWYSVAGILGVIAALAPWLGLDRDGPKDGGAGRAWCVAGALAFAFFAEWHAVFVLPIVACAVLSARRTARGRLSLLLPIVAALAGMFALYRAILPGAKGGMLLAKLARPDQFGARFWSSSLEHLVEMFGVPILVLALVGAFGVAVRAVAGRSDPVDRLAWTLAFFALLALLVYPSAFRIHRYYWVYAVAPVALLAACAMRSLVRGALGQRPGAAAFACVTVVGVIAAMNVARANGLWAADVEEGRRLVEQARTIAAHTSPSEVAAVPSGFERLGTLRYYADRVVVACVSDATMLDALAGSPFQPSVLVLAPRDRASAGWAPDVLWALGPVERDGPFAIVDLRDRGAARTKPTVAQDLPSVTDLRARVDGARLVLDWTPVPGAVSHYRVLAGSAPGVYPIGISTPAPPFRHRLPGRGAIHVAVAPVFVGGRLGPLSTDVRIGFDARSETGVVLGSLIAIVLASTGVFFVAHRRMARGVS